MRAPWLKVRGDLRQHAPQIVLLALVLGTGTAGVVGALNSRQVLEREIAASFASARSPDLALTFDRVEPSMLEIVRSHEDVAEADARRTLLTRSAGAGDDWIGTRLVVVPDFRDQKLGVVHLHGRDWPDLDRGVFIEQSSWGLLGLKEGEPLRIRTPGGGTVTLPVAGLVHDTSVAPGFQERIIYAYASPAVARQLGQEIPLDQIVVQMANRGSGPSRLAGDLGEMLGETGHAVRRTEILPTGHPHSILMQMMLRVLAILSVMALVCSIALAGYVVAIWMKRETRQIGIMKTIGATPRQLAGQYLALIAPLLILTALGAVPAGDWLGKFMIRYNQTALNIDVAAWSVPPGMLLGEFALAVLFPLLAMAFPIIRAARATAREAIQDPGITPQQTVRPSVAQLVRAPGNRQWTFALRNLFRRPWRLAITLTALTAGGGLLLAANFHFSSLMSVVDRTLNAQAHDIQVSFRRPIEQARLATLLQAVPDIAIWEAWQRVTVKFSAAAGSTAQTGVPRTLLAAYPKNSRLRAVPLTSGRWPGDDEADAIIANRAALEFIQAGLGDTINLEPDSRPALKVKIVGTFEEFQGPGFYANQAVFEALVGPRTTTSFLLVQSVPGRIDPLATGLDLAFIAANTPVAALDRRADRRQVMEEHFLGVIGICNLISLAVAALGGICLAAFGCLNVLERVREIGVIRTLGATPARVTLLFVAESACAALVSALLAIGAGTSLTLLLNWLVGTKAFKITIPLVMEGRALGLLFAGVLVVVAGVALPVAGLVRKSVRESLAYE
jgi:putative ABC transport system permease protein